MRSQSNPKSDARNSAYHLPLISGIAGKSPRGFRGSKSQLHSHNKMSARRRRSDASHLSTTGRGLQSTDRLRALPTEGSYHINTGRGQRNPLSNFETNELMGPLRQNLKLFDQGLGRQPQSMPNDFHIDSPQKISRFQTEPTQIPYKRHHNSMSRHHTEFEPEPNIAPLKSRVNRFGNFQPGHLTSRPRHQAHKRSQPSSHPDQGFDPISLALISSMPTEDCEYKKRSKRLEEIDQIVRKQHIKFSEFENHFSAHPDREIQENKVTQKLEHVESMMKFKKNNHKSRNLKEFLDGNSMLKKIINLS
jgi:hypothetical protein